MLLFSTVLKIKDTVTADDFIRLVIKWNDTNPRPENRIRIPAWEGERNFKCGDSHISLEFMEYPGKDIIAVRHEKVAFDGIVWDSDFVLNLREKTLTIRLDRTYSEDALITNGAFSTPHIITLLIQEGFLADDGLLPVLRTPTLVTDEDLWYLEGVFSGETDYDLPVLFVTKNEIGNDPLDITWLASRLKGAAHVFVEQDPALCGNLRSLAGCSRDACGGVRVFYPRDTAPDRRFLFRSLTGQEEERLEKVIRTVIQYWVARRVPALNTWQGVRHAVLNEKWQTAAGEVRDVWNTFDDELAELKRYNEELLNKDKFLQMEVQGLRAKLAASDATPLLYMGDEEDFYQGEIKDIVLSALESALSSAEPGSRRADVLSDILEQNPCEHLGEARKERVKNLFRGYKSLTSAMRQELKDLGMEITGDGKHYKLTYRGDPRYMVTIGKTPSDNRSGDNNASTISRLML